MASSCCQLPSTSYLLMTAGVDGIGATWPVEYGDVESLVNGFKFTNPNGANTGGEGDSGGPIYSYVNAGLVAARSIISSGDPDFPAPCTGVLNCANNPDNPPRAGTSVIFGPDIEEVINSPLMPTTTLSNEP